MKINIQGDLNKQAIEELQDLVRINLESSFGFQSVVEKVECEIVKQYRKELANRRQRQSEELEICVDVGGLSTLISGAGVKKLRQFWRRGRLALHRNDFEGLVTEILGQE